MSARRWGGRALFKSPPSIHHQHQLQRPVHALRDQPFPQHVLGAPEASPFIGPHSKQLKQVMIAAMW